MKEKKLLANLISLSGKATQLGKFGPGKDSKSRLGHLLPLRISIWELLKDSSFVSDPIATNQAASSVVLRPRTQRSGVEEDDPEHGDQFDHGEGDWMKMTAKKTLRSSSVTTTRRTSGSDMQRSPKRPC